MQWCLASLVVQEVVVQVGQLFLAPVAAVGVPLLLKQASDDSSSSELLFSPLPGQERSQEAEAWQVRCHVTIDSIYLRWDAWTTQCTQHAQQITCGYRPLHLEGTLAFHA